MNKTPAVATRRGRPPKIARDSADTKALLIRVGLETLTEFGFSATGLDTILKKAKFTLYFEFVRVVFARAMTQRVTLNNVLNTKHEAG